MMKYPTILIGSTVLALAGCASGPKQQQAQTSPRIQAQYEAEPIVIQGVKMVPTGEYIVVAPDPSATGYNDPYIQRRQERWEAKQDYKDRKQQAKQEYNAEKRAARQEYKQEKAQADAELRAAQPVHGSQRNVDGFANRPSSGK